MRVEHLEFDNCKTFYNCLTMSTLCTNERGGLYIGIPPPQCVVTIIWSKNLYTILMYKEYLARLQHSKICVNVVV